MSETLGILLAFFTGIVAVALLLQSLALLGLHRSVKSITLRMDGLSRDLQKTIESLSGKVEELMSSIQAVAERTRALQDSVASTVTTVNKGVVNAEALIEEASSAARLQIIRIQDIFDTASRRIEESFDILNKGVLKPASEIGAIVAGIRAGLDILLRGSKNPSKRSHQDEEMFI